MEEIRASWAPPPGSTTALELDADWDDRQYLEVEIRRPQAISRPSMTDPMLPRRPHR
jgi:hypothetical protein